MQMEKDVGIKNNSDRLTKWPLEEMFIKQSYSIYQIIEWHMPYEWHIKGIFTVISKNPFYTLYWSCFYSVCTHTHTRIYI